MHRAVAASALSRRCRGIAMAGSVGLVAVLAACGSGGSSGGSAQPSGNGASVSAPVLNGLTGSARSQIADLIEAARSEKSFSWIDSVAASTTASAMFSAFEKEYGLSGIKLSFDRLTSGELSTQIQQEVTSGKITTDFFGTASPELFSELKQSNALQHYTATDSSKYLYAKKYVSEQPGYWIAPDAYAFGIIVNPKLYSKPLTSWKDLSDPSLKGKWDAPDAAANEGSLYWFYGLSKVLPKSVFQSWAANDPKTSSGSSAQEAQKVAEGQIDLTITTGFRASQTVAQTNVPLKVYYPKEGTVLDGQTYGILASSPDPAIAELFDDFLLSEAGQQIYVEKEGIASFYPGVSPPAKDLDYQPKISNMSVIPLDTDTVSSNDLTNARNEWRSLMSK
jgi:iron(III) transport system substrate-binding protein